MRLASAFGLVLAATCASVALAQEIKNPLESAKPGQWARYKLPNDIEQKLSIAKVEGKKVTVKTEVWVHGSLMTATDVVVDLEAKPANEPAEGAAPKTDVKWEDVTVDVAGKKLACKRADVNGAVVTTCADVPVYGTVRTETNGKAQMELVAWGDTPEAKPETKPEARSEPGAGGDEQTASSGDVTIKAVKLGPMKTETGTTVAGYLSFKVTGTNKGDSKKTVSGKLALRTADGKEAGEGTIYLELPPGQPVEKELHVKETSPSGRFEVLIEKVFNF